MHMHVSGGPALLYRSHPPSTLTLDLVEYLPIYQNRSKVKARVSDATYSLAYSLALGGVEVVEGVGEGRDAGGTA